MRKGVGALIMKTFEEEWKDFWSAYSETVREPCPVSRETEARHLFSFGYLAALTESGEAASNMPKNQFLLCMLNRIQEAQNACLEGLQHKGAENN